MSLNEKLKIIRDFQEKYPTSHVGGSIGLMLHGIDLKRDLSDSDIDISIDIAIDIDTILQDAANEECSPVDDFDYRYRTDDTLIEVKVNPLETFERVFYNNHYYNVSLFDSIIAYKRKYATMNNYKGRFKHIEDLKVISTGQFEIQTNLI